MFKYKKLSLRNKLVSIIIITFLTIGGLTLLLIYPNIQNPLLKQQIEESNNFIKATSNNIYKSYNLNNYYIDKLINSAKYRILVVRVFNKNNGIVLADNKWSSTIEGKPFGLRNSKVFGSKLNRIIINNSPGNGDALLLNWSGKRYILSYFSFTANDNNNHNICIVTLRNINYIYSSVNTIFFKMLSIILLYSAFVILLLILFTDYMLNPLNSLRKGISEINRGNLGYNIEINSGDELQEIGDSFNSMSQYLLTEDLRKKEFIQNASHELKTPIAGIKTLSQFLMSTNQNPLEIEYLKDITHEVDRMANVIDDLLTLAELQNSHVLNKTSINTYDLISSTLTNLRFIANKKNISIDSDIQDFTVKIDRLKFERVIINLVDNAIKYSNDHSRIYIKCEKASSNMILQITDSGIGIPKDNLKDIFQRFYRVDKARSRKTGGTGLGLSIVKDIVDAHSGTISVESQESIGTTFTIKIPIN